MTKIKSGATISKFCLFFSFFQLLLSCEFEPSGIYNRAIEENSSPPEINIVELNLSSDTIYLFSGKDVKFNFTSPDLTIYEVDFYLDNSFYASANSSSGTFTLDPLSISEGGHSLQIILLTKSKQQTIADYFGGTAYTFSKSWVIIVDNEYETEISYNNSDGLLHLSWTKYPNKDLKNYILYRCLTITGSNKSEITKLDANDYVDPIYVGERIRYEVAVETRDGKQITWAYVDMPGEIPKPVIRTDQDDKQYIVWEKSRYRNAIKSYILSYNAVGGLYYGDVILKTTIDPEDTLYVMNSILVKLSHLKMHVVPADERYYNPQDYYLFESLLSDPVFGTSFKKDGPYYSLKPVSTDEFLVNTLNALYKYSISDNQFTDEIQATSLQDCSSCLFYSVSSSSSGAKTLIYVPGLQEIFCLFNSSDLSDIIYAKVNITDGHYNVYPVSDQGTGPVLSNTSQGRIYMYDYNTSSILDTIERSFIDYETVKISSGGDYLFLKDDFLRLARYSDHRLNLIYTFETYPRFFEFSAANPDQVVIWDGETVSVRNCSDYSVITAFSMPANGSILNIDFNSNEFLRYSSGHFYIHRLSDGTITHDIMTNALVWYGQNSCYLMGHRIVFIDGQLFNID